MCFVKMNKEFAEHFLKGGYFLVRFTPKNTFILHQELKSYVGKQMIVYPFSQEPEFNDSEYFFNRLFLVEKVVDDVFENGLHYVFFEEDFEFLEKIDKFYDLYSMSDSKIVVVKLIIDSLDTYKKVLALDNHPDKNITLPHIQYRTCSSIENIWRFLDWGADKIEYAVIDLKKDNKDDFDKKFKHLSDDLINEILAKKQIQENIKYAKTVSIR